ncbi:MAG: hypothetical protein JXR51_11810 [Bacteroidales bacterium]|nr:hypothetical protein [Bacteroidales bacterium]MBN2757855.1 hypothetical protein [Bacteroidales bacterium]
MKKRFVLLILFLPFIFLTEKVNAQDVEQELFNAAFPKFGNELKCDENISKMDNKTVLEFRTELKKLSNAIDDLVAFNAGALTDENFKVFTNKDLKKIDTKKLQPIITDKRNQIIEYMGTLTKYGADSINCIKTIFLFDQAYKNKKYNEAYKYWNFLFKFYPMSTKSIYSKGTDVIEYKYKVENNNDVKEKWIDTLMKVYDQRIKYYTDRKYPKGYVLGRKGKDLLKYRQEDVETAYKILEESIKLQNANSEDAVLLTFMQATEGMYRKEKIDAAVVVDNYSMISDLLARRLKNIKENDKVKQAIDGVDLIFTNSQAASCDKIIEAYQAKYNATPNDIPLLNKIAKILGEKDCTDSKLYFDVAIALDKAEPSAFSSYNIAIMSFKKDDLNKSKEYYDKAIKMEKTDSLKAKYYYESAIVLSKLGQKVASRTNALKAAELRSDFGAPYLLIATLYASSGCDEMTSPKSGNLSRISYWVAVDKLNKAKAVDPSIADQVNKLIYQYSSNFPNKEDAFFYGITKGINVTVGCWINETTTARF